jgi:phenylacetate-coenzyme A ligase PaaK-like adenylate-forming protein
LIFDEVKIFPDFFRYAVLLSSDNILNFQIIQVANNQLLVKLKVKENCDFNAISKTVEKKILTLLSERNIQHCSISLAPLMHDDFYNKFRRVQKAKF